jgi:hypothetical protein
MKKRRRMPIASKNPHYSGKTYRRMLDKVREADKHDERKESFANYMRRTREHAEMLLR